MGSPTLTQLYPRCKPPPPSPAYHHVDFKGAKCLSHDRLRLLVIGCNTVYCIAYASKLRYLDSLLKTPCGINSNHCDGQLALLKKKEAPVICNSDPWEYTLSSIIVQAQAQARNQNDNLLSQDPADHGNASSPIGKLHANLDRQSS